jgi:hypothetical protein
MTGDDIASLHVEEISTHERKVVNFYSSYRENAYVKHQLLCYGYMELCTSPVISIFPCIWALDFIVVAAGKL